MEIRAFRLLFPSSIGLGFLGLRLAGSVEALASLQPLRCPLHAWTGLLCPSCGLGRSILAAWTFDFQTAWKHHFLGPMLFVLAAAICICGYSPLLALKRAPFAARWGLLALYLAWGVNRNLAP